MMFGDVSMVRPQRVPTMANPTLHGSAVLAGQNDNRSLTRSPAGHGAQGPLGESTRYGLIPGERTSNLHGAHGLAGAGEEIAQIFIPGSVGSGVIGKTVDTLATQVNAVIKQVYPGLGAVLEGVADLVTFMAKPINHLMQAGVQGVVAYLPEAAANAVIKDMQDKPLTWATEAAKDTIAALQVRVGATGNPASDIKQGRDKILAESLGALMSFVGIGATSSRMASRIEGLALAAGARDYQAAAAAAYTMLAGLDLQGIPLPGVATDWAAKAEAKAGIAVIKNAVVKANEGAKVRVLSVASPGTLTAWLAKVGPDPKWSLEWLADAWAKKQGIKPNAPGSGGGGGTTIVVIMAALGLYAASR